jgi:prephenate dehydrogenase
VCVVTPTKKTNRNALRKVEQLWQTIGGCVLRLSPETHDTLVSRSSHLPHVVAAALVNRVLGSGQASQQSALCANGFRDTTRIASGSPEMWRDIALANRKNLASTLGEFVRDLQTFQKALNESDAKTVVKFFESAKRRRDDWCACCASPSPE